MLKNFISVLELRQLRIDGEISKNEYHEQVVDMFSKSLNFKICEMIGRGSFSTVFRVGDENRRRASAMRIVLKEDVGPKERTWRQLHHESILTLLDAGDSSTFGLTWFMSPVVETSLEEALHKKIFKNDPMIFKLAASWLKSMTSALDYLHNEGLSFLNLKLSNVMLCSDQNVKLFGFRHLDSVGQLTTG